MRRATYERTHRFGTLAEPQRNLAADDACCTYDKAGHGAPDLACGIRRGCSRHSIALQAAARHHHFRPPARVAVLTNAFRSRAVCSNWRAMLRIPSRIAHRSGRRRCGNRRSCRGFPGRPCRAWSAWPGAGTRSPPCTRRAAPVPRRFARLPPVIEDLQAGRLGQRLKIRRNFLQRFRGKAFHIGTNRLLTDAHDA